VPCFFRWIVSVLYILVYLKCGMFELLKQAELNAMDRGDYRYVVLCYFDCICVFLRVCRAFMCVS
jgi:hypothetical protein